MALANYKITDLTVETDENGIRPSEMLTRSEVISRFAPGFDLNDPVHAEDAEKWLDAFVDDALQQMGRAIELERLDVRALSLDAEARLTEKVAEVEAIEDEIKAIAAEYLRDLTEDEVTAGDIYPAKPGSKKLVDAVEQQRLRIGKSASKVLEGNRNLPDHVRAVLEARAEADRVATIKRTAPKKVSK